MTTDDDNDVELAARQCWHPLFLTLVCARLGWTSRRIPLVNWLGLPSLVPWHLSAHFLHICVNLYVSGMCLGIVVVLQSILMTGIPMAAPSTLATAHSTTTIPACQVLTMPKAQWRRCCILRTPPHPMHAWPTGIQSHLVILLIHGRHPLRCLHMKVSPCGMILLMLMLANSQLRWYPGLVVTSPDAPSHILLHAMPWLCFHNNVLWSLSPKVSKQVCCQLSLWRRSDYLFQSNQYMNPSSLKIPASFLWHFVVTEAQYDLFLYQ